jgi:hypothetical protein
MHFVSRLSREFDRYLPNSLLCSAALAFENTLKGRLYQTSELFFGKIVFRIAEVALQFRAMLLVRHLKQFLPAQTDQVAFHPVPAAIAQILAGCFFCNLKSLLPKQALKDSGWIQSALGKRIGDGIRKEYLVFEIANKAFIRPRHQLQHIASGCYNALIRGNQNAERYDCGHLFRISVVICNILPDFARNQVNIPHIGLFQAKILDHIQIAVASHSGSHIKFSRRVERKIDFGVVHVPTDIGLIIGHGDDSPSGPSPLIWSVKTSFSFLNILDIMAAAVSVLPSAADATPEVL